ncbi:helix-turn-helix domain-containing protein [Senegalia massiliensis]|uniref:XRE family transcriptional regulator n=1 Tax=Senegalia massiliensis TaxID=1720316 RepID=A0A845QXF8_9CLOT|nr:helix-turn-helix transcriptional regulator [Senegalia massiliensis]NBI07647.1 XRE family transcriptional regulator [Senegalia massiliensis]
MTQRYKIITPDYLPNNIKVIRETRNLSLKKMSEKLNIDEDFLRLVENQEKNLSGKSTIKIMKEFNLTFYKLYDIKDNVICNVTNTFDNILETTLEFEPEEILNNELHKKLLNNKVVSKEIVLDDTKSLKENNLLNESIKKVSNENKVKGNYHDFEVKNILYENNKIFLNLDIIYKEKRTEKKEFDIHMVDNYLNEGNLKLAKMLEYRGFPDKIITIEKKIDNKKIKLRDKHIELDKKYKIPEDNDVNFFEETNILKLSDNRVKLVYDGETIKSVKFKVVKPEINCVKAIRVLLNKSLEEMHESLGLSYNGYINLESRNHKISTKTMWRLVNKLNIPLELIINVDEYYDIFCS